MKRWRAMQALVSTALTGQPVGSLDGGEPKPKRHEHVEREGDGDSDGESGASRWTRYCSTALRVLRAGLVPAAGHAVLCCTSYRLDATGMIRGLLLCLHSAVCSVRHFAASFTPNTFLLLSFAESGPAPGR